MVAIRMIHAVLKRHNVDVYAARRQFAWRPWKAAQQPLAGHFSV